MRGAYIGDRYFVVPYYSDEHTFDENNPRITFLPQYMTFSSYSPSLFHSGYRFNGCPNGAYILYNKQYLKVQHNNEVIV